MFIFKVRWSTFTCAVRRASAHVKHFNHIAGPRANGSSKLVVRTDHPLPCENIRINSWYLFNQRTTRADVPLHVKRHNRNDQRGPAGRKQPCETALKVLIFTIMSLYIRCV